VSMCKRFLAFAVAAVFVLASTQTAEAQRRGRNGRRGSPGISIGYESGYYDGWRTPGYGFNSNGAPYTTYGTNAWNYGPEFAGNYYTPTYAGATYPQTTTLDGLVPSQSYYYDPRYPNQMGDRSVTMNFILPAADAKLWFGDVSTSATGATRVFQTPALEPGTEYKYDLRVTWMENGRQMERKKQVTFRLGQNLTVDLRGTPGTVPEQSPAPIRQL